MHLLLLISRYRWNGAAAKSASILQVFAMYKRGIIICQYMRTCVCHKKGFIVNLHGVPCIEHSVALMLHLQDICVSWIVPGLNKDYLIYLSVYSVLKYLPATINVPANDIWPYGCVIVNCIWKYIFVRCTSSYSFAIITNKVKSYNIFWSNIIYMYIYNTHTSSIWYDDMMICMRYYIIYIPIIWI